VQLFGFGPVQDKQVELQGLHKSFSSKKPWSQIHWVPYIYLCSELLQLIQFSKEPEQVRQFLEHSWHWIPFISKKPSLHTHNPDFSSLRRESSTQDKQLLISGLSQVRQEGWHN
jgi:hypothetical protein